MIESNKNIRFIVRRLLSHIKYLLHDFYLPDALNRRSVEAHATNEYVNKYV